MWISELTNGKWAVYEDNVRISPKFDKFEDAQNWENKNAFRGAPCTFSYGWDGRLYAVFDSEVEAEQNEYRFLNCPTASCGGFQNAYDVTELAWNV